MPRARHTRQLRPHLPLRLHPIAPMPRLQPRHVRNPQRPQLPIRPCPRAGRTTPTTRKSPPSHNFPTASLVPTNTSRSMKTSKRLCARSCGSSVPPSDTLLHTAAVSLPSPPTSQQPASPSRSLLTPIRQRLSQNGKKEEER